MDWKITCVADCDNYCTRKTTSEALNIVYVCACADRGGGGRGICTGVMCQVIERAQAHTPAQADFETQARTIERRFNMGDPSMACWQTGSVSGGLGLCEGPGRQNAAMAGADQMMQDTFIIWIDTDHNPGGGMDTRTKTRRHKDTHTHTQTEPNMLRHRCPHKTHTRTLRFLKCLSLVFIGPGKQRWSSQFSFNQTRIGGQ